MKLFIPCNGILWSVCLSLVVYFREFRRCSFWIMVLISLKDIQILEHATTKKRNDYIINCRYIMFLAHFKNSVQRSIKWKIPFLYKLSEVVTLIVCRGDWIYKYKRCSTEMCWYYKNLRYYFWGSRSSNTSFPFPTKSISLSEKRNRTICINMLFILVNILFSKEKGFIFNKI